MICPTCLGDGVHGGHCPNAGKPEAEWTSHEQRERGRAIEKLQRAGALIWEVWRADSLASDELELRRAIGIVRSAEMKRNAEGIR